MDSPTSIVDVYDSLVRAGLWHYVLEWTVGFAMTGIIVKGLGGKIRRAVRAHTAEQRRIADLLDTNTPGGLTDVLAALENKSAVDDESH